ncbi:MAG: hypothetical protein K2Y37_23700 [Pirellulales bacterium]|nr:hypothetical protein [Pirellulales bacterium]
MRKVFRRLGPWITVVLFAARTGALTVRAAAPDAATGPALSSPSAAGSMATPAGRRTPRASTRPTSGRTADQWQAAATRDDRFASPQGPVEPALSQAVANGWRRSARASLRQPNRSTARASGHAPAAAIELKVAPIEPNPTEGTVPPSEAPSPESTIAQVLGSDTLTPDADTMPALAAPTNGSAGNSAKLAVAVAVASPRTHAPPLATRSMQPARPMNRPTAMSRPAAMRQPVAMSQPAAMREPVAMSQRAAKYRPATMSQPAIHRAPASLATVPSPREPIAATPTPLAERQGLLGLRAARLRSAFRLGRADVQPAADLAAQSRPGFGAVQQAAGFEGTVIRDVPATEAEIPNPDAADSTTGLAQSTTSECAECGDDSCDDCCTECPRRRPLLALNDKLDECKAKCCACCNQESWNNCNCNGSYKFPVPPLYTYHWPGLYSAELMTDYHSPWRFPPLKPYTDEVPRAGEGPPQSLSMVVPTSHELSDAETAAETAVENVAESRIIGEPEPLSKKLCREYGIQE